MQGEADRRGKLVYGGLVPGLEFVDQELAALEEAGRLRTLRTVSGAQGPRVSLDGRDVVNFSSNDYLGLASSPALVEAAREGARSCGAGAGASRLIAGNQDGHDALERALAGWQGKQAAVAFNSGYQANLGVLTSLAGRGDLIVSDELNHASLIDGCRLSRADVEIYRHGDAGHAEELLAGRGGGDRRRVIVTDALFSMDGDAAPVRELSAVAERHSAILVVDEAHAVGVLGPKGRGLAAQRNAAVDVHVGTLGKAFGSFGAYVAGDRRLRDLLINRARSFIFTTALPPSVVGASREAVALVGGAEGERRRRALEGHIRVVREGLRDLGLLAPGSGAGPIFPVWVGGDAETMRCCESLLGRGIYVQGVRPPTVPRGTSRLRLALMASHEPAHVEHCLEALRELRDTGMIPAACAVRRGRGAKD